MSLDVQAILLQNVINQRNEIIKKQLEFSIEKTKAQAIINGYSEILMELDAILKNLDNIMKQYCPKEDAPSIDNSADDKSDEM